MSIHRRLILQFFTQCLIIFLLLFVTALTTLAMIGFFLEKEDIKQDLAQASEQYLADHIQTKDGKITIDAELDQLIEKQGGWLLIYDPKGQLLASYHVPDDVDPQFTDMLSTDRTKNVYMSWLLTAEDQEPIVVIYGRKDVVQHFTDAILPRIDWKYGRLNLTEKMKQDLQERSGSVLLVDNQGQVRDAYNEQREKVTAEELYHTLQDQAYNVNGYTDEASGLTMIIRLAGQTESMESVNQPLQHQLKNPLLIVLVALIVFFVLGSAWYASRFGSPLLAFMGWIENLGRGIYTAPADSQGRPVVFNKNGKLKRKYKLYREIIETLQKVTKTLEENEQQRAKMIRTHEEWISGLSHDLKTPLSSIMGYVKMLQSEQYDWNLEEKKTFLKTIDEKSTYMFELIEDLTLTYRLKNESLPIVKEHIDINEAIRRTIIQLVNMQDASHIQFEMNNKQDQLLVPVDPKWWQRIVDNIPDERHNL